MRSSWREREQRAIVAARTSAARPQSLPPNDQPARTIGGRNSGGGGASGRAATIGVASGATGALYAGDGRACSSNEDCMQTLSQALQPASAAGEAASSLPP